MPVYLIHFITNRCTCKCGHCFIDRFASKDAELSLDEIEKFSLHAGKLLFVFLTGGEPFLRNDIAEIAYIYYKNNKVAKIQIPTNGSLTDKIIMHSEEMAKRCPNMHIGVSISIDQIGVKHDEIRKHPGLFAKCLETYKGLKDLQEKYNNFNVNITINVSSYNEDALDKIYPAIKDIFAAKNIFNTLTRGNPRSKDAKVKNIENFKKLNLLIDNDLKNKKMAGYQHFFLSEVINAKNLISRNMIYEIAKYNRYKIPCYAGKLAFVLSHNGKIYPCEIREENWGNIRDFGYDFKKIWFSQKAEISRQLIKKNKCYCTHECFVTVNIIFNIKYWPKLLIRSLILKVNSLLRNISPK
ncbi:MAG: radical SAM protein [Candidatus Omnitrophica bacterium]|nr:radical SAM protein [Candidatus Omnitrophota bacterium]